jgi:hypothetical protein
MQSKVVINVAATGLGFRPVDAQVRSTDQGHSRDDQAMPDQGNFSN